MQEPCGGGARIVRFSHRSWLREQARCRCRRIFTSRCRRRALPDGVRQGSGKRGEPRRAALTPELLQNLGQKECGSPFDAAHRADTFRRSEDDPRQHQMHSEYAEVGAMPPNWSTDQSRRRPRSASALHLSGRSRPWPRRTTANRPLHGQGRPVHTPGFQFRVTDDDNQLPSAPHHAVNVDLRLSRVWFLPRAYQEAIDHRYRFYSFGDAMLVLCYD